MSSFTRVGGYLGLALSLIAIVLLAIVTSPWSATSSDLRDKSVLVGLSGYTIVLYWFGYLAFRGEGRWTRALSVAGILGLIVALVCLYLFLKSLEPPS